MIAQSGERYMTKMSLCAVLAGLAALMPCGASAQISKCDGTWTNETCEGEVQASFKEVPASEPDPAARELSRRRIWLHDLEMLRLKAKREHDITVSTKPVEDICLTLKTPARECSNAIAAKETEINQLVTERARLALERERQEAQPSEGPTTVNVINQREVIFVRPRRRHHHHHHTHGGTSVELSASGSAGNISAGVSTHAGASTITLDRPRPIRPDRGRATGSTMGSGALGGLKR